MDWTVSQWKSGLPALALQKINEIENQVDRLQKERQQKMLQMDSCQQTIEKQKIKLEESKTFTTTLEREKQTLHDENVQLTKQLQQKNHEINAKDARINSQEGQLAQAKKQNEQLLTKISQYENELEQASKTIRETEILKDQLTVDLKHYQGLVAQQSDQINTFKEKIKTMEQETKCSQLAPAIECSGIMEPEPFFATPAKKPCYAAESAKKKMEESKHYFESPMKPSSQIVQSQKLSFEVDKLRMEKDAASDKVSNLEQRIKQLSQELECQRHNAEASKNALELKFKDKERNFREDIRLNTQTIGELERELTETRNRLQQELTHAQKSLDTTKAHLEKLESQKMLSEQTVIELKKQVSELQSENHQNTTIINDLNKSLKQETEMVSKLTSRVENQDIKLKESTTALETTKQQLSQKEQEVQKSNQSLEEKQKEIVQLHNQLANFKNQYLALENQKTSLEKQISEIQRDLQKECQSTKKVNEQLESLQKKYQESQEVVSNQNISLQQLQIKLNQAKKDIDDKETKVGALQANLDKNKQELNDHRIDVGKLKNENAELKKSVEVYVKDKEALSKAVHQKTEDVEKLKFDVSCMTRSLDDKDCEFKKLQANVNHLECELHQKTDAIEKLEKSLQDNSKRLEEMDALKNEIETTKKDSVIKQGQLLEAQKELEMVKEEFSKNENRLKNLQVTEQRLQEANILIEQQEKSIALLKENISSKEKEIYVLKEKLSENESNILSLEKAKKELEEQEEKIKDFRQQINILEEKLSSEERKVQQLNSELQAQKSEVKEKEKTCEMLSRNLGELQSLHDEYIKTAEKDLTESHKTVQTCEAEKCELLQTITEYTEKQKKLSEAFEQLNADFIQTKNLLQDKETEVATVKRELADAFKNEEELNVLKTLLEEQTLDIVKLKESVTGKESQLLEKEKELECLTHLMEEFSALQKAKDDQDTDYQTLSEQLSTCKEELEKKSLYVDNLQHKIYSLQGEVNTVITLKEETAKKDEEILHLKEKIQIQESNLSDQLQSIQQLERKISELNTEMDEYEEIKHTLVGKNSEIDKLSLEIFDLKDEVEAQKETCIIAQKEAERLGKELCSYEELRLAAEAKEHLINELKEQLRESDNSVSFKQLEIESLQEEVDALKKNIDVIEMLQKELAVKEDIIAKLNEEQTAILRHLVEKDETLKSLASDVSRLQLEIQKSKEFCHMLVEQNSEMNSLHIELLEVKEELQKRETEFDSLQGKYDLVLQKADSVDLLQQQLKEQSITILELQERLTEKEKTCEALNEARQLLTCNLQQLQDEKSALMESLSSQTNTIEKLKLDLENQKQLCYNISVSNDELQQQLQLSKVECQELAHTLAERNTERDELEINLMDMTGLLEEKMKLVESHQQKIQTVRSELTNELEEKLALRDQKEKDMLNQFDEINNLKSEIEEKLKAKEFEVVMILNLEREEDEAFLSKVKTLGLEDTCSELEQELNLKTKELETKTGSTDKLQERRMAKLEHFLNLIYSIRNKTEESILEASTVGEGEMSLDEDGYLSKSLLKSQMDQLLKHQESLKNISALREERLLKLADEINSDEDREDVISALIGMYKVTSARLKNKEVIVDNCYDQLKVLKKEAPTGIGEMQTLKSQIIQVCSERDMLQERINNIKKMAETLIGDITKRALDLSGSLELDKTWRLQNLVQEFSENPWSPSSRHTSGIVVSNTSYSMNALESESISDTATFVNTDYSKEHLSNQQNLNSTLCQELSTLTYELQSKLQFVFDDNTECADIFQRFKTKVDQILHLVENLSTSAPYSSFASSYCSAKGASSAESLADAPSLTNLTSTDEQHFESEPAESVESEDDPFIYCLGKAKRLVTELQSTMNELLKKYEETPVHLTNALSQEATEFCQKYQSLHNTVIQLQKDFLSESHSLQEDSNSTLDSFEGDDVFRVKSKVKMTSDGQFTAATHVHFVIGDDHRSGQDHDISTSETSSVEEKSDLLKFCQDLDAEVKRLVNERKDLLDHIWTVNSNLTALQKTVDKVIKSKLDEGSGESLLCELEGVKKKCEDLILSLQCRDNEIQLLSQKMRTLQNRITNLVHIHSGSNKDSSTFVSLNEEASEPEMDVEIKKEENDLNTSPPNMSLHVESVQQDDSTLVSLVEGMKRELTLKEVELGVKNEEIRLLNSQLMSLEVKTQESKCSYADLEERVNNIQKVNVQLESINDEQKNRIDGLTKTVEDLNKTIEEVEETLQETFSEKEKHKLLLEESERKIVLMQQEIERLKTQADEQSEKYRASQQEKIQVCDEMKTKIAEMQTVLTLKESLYLSQSEHVQDLEKKLLDSQEKLSELIATKNGLESEVEQFRLEMQDLVCAREEASALREHVMILEEEKLLLQEQVSNAAFIEIQLKESEDKLKKDLEALEMQKDSLLSKISGLEHKILVLTDEGKKLEDHLKVITDDYQMQKQQLTDEKNTLFLDFSDLRESYSQMASEKEKLEFEKQDLLKHAEELEQEMSKADHIKQKNKDLKEELDQLQAKADLAEEFETKITSLEEEKSSLRLQINKLLNAEAKVAELQSKLETAEEQIILLSERLEFYGATEKELSEAKNVMSKMEQELRNTKSDLENAMDTARHCEELREQLSSESSSKNQLQQKIETLNDRLQNESESLQEKILQVECLEAEIFETKGKIQKLEGELTKEKMSSASLREHLSLKTSHSNELETLVENLREDLKAQKETSERQVQNVTNLKLNLESKLKEALQTTEELLKQNEELKLTEDDLSFKLNEKECELSKLLEDHGEEVASFKGKLDDYETKLKHTEDQLVSINKEVEHLRSALEDKDKYCNALQDDLKCLQLNKETQEEEIKKLNLEVSALTENVRVLSEEKKSFDTEMPLLKTEKEQLKTKLQESDRLQQQQVKQLRLALSTSKRLEKEYAALEEHSARLEQEGERLKKEMKDKEEFLKAELEREKVKELKDDLEKKSNELKIKSEEASDAWRKVREVSKELNKSKELVEFLRCRMKNYREQIKSLKGEVGKEETPVIKSSVSVGSLSAAKRSPVVTTMNLKSGGSSSPQAKVCLTVSALKPGEGRSKRSLFSSDTQTGSSSKRKMSPAMHSVLRTEASVGNGFSRNTPSPRRTRSSSRVSKQEAEGISDKEQRTSMQNRYLSGSNTKAPRTLSRGELGGCIPKTSGKIEDPDALRTKDENCKVQ